ncbi:MAG: hypothetical protein NTV86_10280 [Planctomycetota bacterium]|nr:hypothetical protein [Planctomycetota bacterium]
MVVRTLQGKRRFLWSASVAALAGIVAVIASAAWSPLPSPTASPRGHGAASRPASAPAQARPLSDYAAIAARPLRGPLFDPKPAPVVAPAPPPKPTLNAVVTGTAVGGEQAFAVFRSGPGEEQLLGVGEAIAGATILAIGEDSVTVQFNGETIHLKVQPPKEEP